MFNALKASAVLPHYPQQTSVVDLRTRLHACAVDERGAWSALQHQLEEMLDLHSHEIHVEVDDQYLILRINTLDGFVETRLLPDDPLRDAIRQLDRQLWPDSTQPLVYRAWFLIGLYEHDYLFQVDYVTTSAGSTHTMRRLYDVRNPLPQLEQLITLPDQAMQLRKLVHLPQGLILLADADRISRVRTARALAQCLTGPQRRILLSETTCHPLVPGTTQITLPLDAKEEHHKAWRQACDMSYDVIIALEIDHAPSTLTRLASEKCFVIQGACASRASQALAQLIASGTRPEAIARVLTHVIVQHQVALACEQCRCPSPLDDKLNQWVTEQAPVRPGAINDWLTQRLSDNFVQAQGCEQCNDTGVEKVILVCECVEMTREIADALYDGDVFYAMECLDRSDGFSTQLLKLARAGTICIEHAFASLEQRNDK